MANRDYLQAGFSDLSGLPSGSSRESRWVPMGPLILPAAWLPFGIIARDRDGSAIEWRCDGVFCFGYRGVGFENCLCSS